MLKDVIHNLLCKSLRMIFISPSIFSSVSHADEPANATEIVPHSETTRSKRFVRASHSFYSCTFFHFSARLFDSQHILQTFLHILQMGISYLLMLIAMTFNTYLFLAIILGAGVGHFLFGWRRSSIIDYNEHCH